MTSLVVKGPMPDPTEDVTPDSSPGPQDSPNQDTAPAAVNADVTPDPKDRPVENLKAEFDRKFGALSQQLDQLMSVLAAAPQAQPSQPVRQDYSDEQLAELARAGSVEASLKLQERVAQRAAQTVVSGQQKTNLVQSQLQALYGRYPQLTNPQDPLTVEAMKAKSILIRSGYDPKLPETDLEAIKLAVVDNPHLAVKPVTPNPAGDFTRRASVQPQASMDGNTTRRESRPNQPGKRIDPKVAAIAARMGVKDPAKAMADFEERNRKGRNSITPTVSLIIREQE